MNLDCILHGNHCECMEALKSWVFKKLLIGDSQVTVSWTLLLATKGPLAF